MPLVQSNLPCNDCGSSDAMAEYTDNTYCFSCQVSRRKSNTAKSFFAELEHKVHPPKAGVLDWPGGFSDRIPEQAKAWLLKAHIYADTREKYHIGYVRNGIGVNMYLNQIALVDRLILPYVKLGRLVWYQARAFREDDRPKYLMFGNKDELFEILHHDQDELVIVEDMLSAIRIGEFTNVVSLQGTSLNKKNMLHYIPKYGTIKIWMDGDAPGQAAAKKLITKLQLLKRPEQIINIVTEQDPKCLLDSEIRQQLDKRSTT